MKRRIFGVLLLVVFAVAVFTGCAAKNMQEDKMESRDNYTITETNAYSAKEEEIYGSNGDMDNDDGTKTDSQTSFIAAGDSVGFEAYNAILAKRKVIFNANVTIEVESFNEAYGKIQSIILGKGFVQSSQMDRDYVIVNDEKVYVTKGVIVIRVMRERFDSVLNNIKGMGELLDENIYSDDVTDVYFDTESRLKVLRLEEERLLEYLNKVDDPDTLFKYERRLTEVRGEIESMTGTLRKWDGLVELSTITINLREKYPVQAEEEPDEDVPYFRELGDKFMKSVKGVVKFLGNFVIFLAQALPVLVVLGILAAVVLLLVRLCTRIFGRKELPSKDVKKQ
jgi:hypothetical protein